MKESNEPSIAGEPEAATARRKKRGIVRRIYDWTIHWAETPYALWALLAIAFVEASFFPIPPDVLLIAMALGAPKRSLRYAAVCTAGSVAGALLGYGVGKFFFEALGVPVINFYGVWESFDKISAGFQSHGFLYIFTAALTPIPFKVFTIAAGLCSVDLGVLVAASLIGRGLRFFAVAALFRLFGARIKRFIDRYFNLLTIAFLALLVLGFLCVRILWRGDRAESVPNPSYRRQVQQEGNGYDER